MTNPKTFDGKPSTPFNVWWKSVTKYLSFYPETSDQQKIAWVGTLLTGTAKAWDLHRYDTQGENDSWVNYCYTLNTTGSEYGYGPGRKVSETRHTVLGRHTETGQPTASGLGSGQPTLRHQEVPGPNTGTDQESASAATEEDNLGGHHKKDKQSEGNGNARSCESKSRNRSGVVSRGTAQRNNTTSRESRYRHRRLEGPRRYPCTPWSGDTRDDATTRILVIDTRLWR